MKNSQGYTLMELAVGVSIIAVTMVAGLAIFFRSFYVTAGVDSAVSLDGQARSTMNAFDRQVLYAKMIDIDGYGRDICMASSSSYLTGETIKVADQYGQTIIGLKEDADGVPRLASNSAFLSPLTMPIEKLVLRWDCGDLFDKISIEMRASTFVGKTPVLYYKRTFFGQVIMRNSGSYIN